MTSQTVISPSSGSMPQSQTASSQGAAEGKGRNSNAIKALYQSDHQEEYLDLSAQIESLLEKLQMLHPV